MSRSDADLCRIQLARGPQCPRADASPTKLRAGITDPPLPILTTERSQQKLSVACGSRVTIIVLGTAPAKTPLKRLTFAHPYGAGRML
jgi:hypothetical protein